MTAKCVAHKATKRGKAFRYPSNGVTKTRNSCEGAMDADGNAKWPSMCDVRITLPLDKTSNSVILVMAAEIIKSDLSDLLSQ